MTSEQGTASHNPPAGKRKVGRARKLWTLLCIALMVPVLAAVLYAAFRFLPERAVTYDTMEDHFKYGSTGGDRVTGFPIWIW